MILGIPKRFGMWTELHRKTYERVGARYPSDMTDGEWARLEPLIPAAKPGGRPRTTNMREAINAILYLLRTGCPWRYLLRWSHQWHEVACLCRADARPALSFGKIVLMDNLGSHKRAGVRKAIEAAGAAACGPDLDPAQQVSA
jgi:transposase